MVLKRLNFPHAKYNFGEKHNPDTFLTVFVRSTPLLLNTLWKVWCRRHQTVEVNYKTLKHRKVKQRKMKAFFFTQMWTNAENANEEEKKHWPTSCDLALSCWKGVTSLWWVCVCVLGYRELRSGQGECLETTQAPIIRGPSLETEGGI